MFAITPFLSKHAKGLLKGRLLDLVDGFVEVTGDIRLHPATPQFLFAFLLAQFLLYNASGFIRPNVCSLGVTGCVSLLPPRLVRGSKSASKIRFEILHWSCMALMVITAVIFNYETVAAVRSNKISSQQGLSRSWKLVLGCFYAGGIISH